MLNKCEFIGRLGKDPEIRSTQDGREIANLTLACSEKWKDKNSGEQKERTEWVKISVFSEGLVKVIKKYLTKGSQIYVCGKMQTRKWQDQSGADRYSTEIVMQGFDCKLLMLSPAKAGGQSEGSNDYASASSGSRAAESFNSAELDDEIPF